MLDFQREETMKRERRFISSYTNFKSEVNFTRLKLKSECCEAELKKMREILEQCRREVERTYEDLRTLTTPLPDIIRKMDTCTSVTSEVIIILEDRCRNSNQTSDPAAMKKSLSQLLQRENARSIHGSTVSRLSGSSCRESQVSTKRAEAAARLAAKRAEIHREDEISMLREKLKKLENQRDLEVLEAECKAYAGAEDNAAVEGSEAGNTLQASESLIHINKPGNKTPQIASTPIQTEAKKDERSNAEEHRLRVLVDCVYAGSKDRLTVSRVNYHSKTQRAEAAAELAANKVAMKCQAAIDTQRQLLGDLECKQDRKVNTGSYQKLYATKTDQESSTVGNATLCKNSRVTGTHHQAPVTPLACPKVFKADNQSPDILKRSAQEDRKFQKVQFLPAQIRAPDDCHSMDSLVALKKEVDPNKILGLVKLNVSPKRISSSLNPFNQLSLTSSGQLNKPLVNNSWRYENTKKSCNLIHEPSLKNSAIHSQTSSELPKGKLGYQKDMNTLNSSPGTLNVWKPLESTEPVKETETTSMNDDALSDATKEIRNKVKDASSEQNHLHDQRRLVKNLFDQESSIKERDRIYPEKERSKISKRVTEKLSSVIPKRHGRLPQPNSLRVLKLAKH